MRRPATLTIILALMVSVVACRTVSDGTAQPAPAVPSTVDEIPRITVEELKAELDKGPVTGIDVRGQTSFEAGHLPGAVNIPELEIKNRAGELPRDRLIVTYCT